MKNVIKKTCAIVMMTAVLFTAVIPKPISASHQHTYAKVGQHNGYYTRVEHNVNGVNCTVMIYKIYLDYRCTECGSTKSVPTNSLTERHSVQH